MRIENRIRLFDAVNRIEYVSDVFKTDETGVEAIHEVRCFCEEHYGKEEGDDTT